MQEHTYNHWESETHEGFIWLHLYITHNIKIKTSFHGAKHVSKCAMQSLASHQPSESHLVANSELKSPPNDALVAGVVTMNAASVPNR